MITGIPTPEQFRQAGIDYLLMAYGDLIRLLDTAKGYAELEEHEAGLVDKHWAGAARKLATCGSLVHQGAEFLLKSRIANVSPYLLLDSGRETWSAAVAAADTDFATLKTIDAQLLPRVHDSTCAERLTPEFKKRLEMIRQRRNAATHSVVAMVSSNVGGMIGDILEIAHNLIGERSWPRVVRDDAYGGPAPWSDYHGVTQRGLLERWGQTLELLTASDYLRYLGFSKKQRRYLCPQCHTGDIPPDPPIKLAYLDPNTPTSREIYCFVCDERNEVVRQKCLFCAGNVILREDAAPLCLSCNRANEEVDQ